MHQKLNKFGALEQKSVANVPTSESGIGIANRATLGPFEMVRFTQSLCDTPFESVRYGSYGPVRNSCIERFRVTGMTKR